MLVALRTQQIIAEETGVINVADPLGGSYAIEALTDRIEREAIAYIRHRSTSWAASMRAIELGFPQKEIADASYRYQRQLDSGREGRSSASTSTGSTTKRRSRPARRQRQSSASRSSACGERKRARNAAAVRDTARHPRVRRERPRT